MPTRAAQEVLPGVSSARRCGGCEGDHRCADCPYKDAVCYSCGKTAGHISRCYPEREMAPERGEAANPLPAATATERPRIHQVSGGGSPTTAGNEYATPCGDAQNVDYDEHRGIWMLTGDGIPSPGASTIPPLRFSVKLNGVLISLEVDTGAAYSICSKRTFDTFAGTYEVRPTSLILRDYSGVSIPLEGVADVSAEYGVFQAVLPIFIAREDRVTLLGRNWLSPLGLHVTCDSAPSVLLTQADKAGAERVSQECATAYASQYTCFNRALAGSRVAR